jgi:hypothetical protein
LEVWVAEVVDAMEADLETLVAGIEDRIMARDEVMKSGSSAPFHSTVRRGVSAGVRDALARLRCQAELPGPEELPPDLIALHEALAAQEAFWDHFEVLTERTLGDPARCWEVLKTAQVRLRGHPARLAELFFRRACDQELTRGSAMTCPAITSR